MTGNGAIARKVNVEEADWASADEDGGRWARIGRLAGSNRLGCTLEEIVPGGRPARYHYHLANEEAVFVLEGHGELRTPAGVQAIDSGDYAAFPAGETGAHAVENTGDGVLRCLFVSTMDAPDIVVYPDDDEVHVVGGVAPGALREERTFDATFRYPINVE